MKKVLVPTDFSDNSIDALQYAINIFEDIPGKFYILNTFTVGASRTSTLKNQSRDTHLYQLMLEESQNSFVELRKKLSANLNNDKHEYITLSQAGRLTDVISYLIDKKQIDLVVMGTTGASGLKKLFGSNTVEIINHVDNCPVLSVPLGFRFQYLERVLFATDFKRDFKEENVRLLKELQLIHNFSLTMAWVNKESLLDEIQLQHKANLAKLLYGHNFKFEELIFDQSITNTIETYAKKENLNLISLVKYEHNFIEFLTHEAVINEISFSSKIPLLILPEN